MNSQYSNFSLNEFDSFGPRPPVPGKESRRKEMTEGRDGPCTWAKSLATLLDDPEGVELFTEYAKSEGGIHDDRIKFYFAIEGLKQETKPEKVEQIVRAIYRRFIRKSELKVPEEIRQTIKEGIRNDGVPTLDVFEKIQYEILQVIDETTYRNFLSSDLYLQYLNRHAQQHHGSSWSSNSTSSSASAEHSNLISRSSTLPTLHEDAEFGNSYNIDSNYGPSSLVSSSCRDATATTSSGSGNIPLTLTRDSLLKTQHRRLEMRSTRSQHFPMPYSIHMSYNPVSHRDSELHSLSSGRTDSDTMSLSSDGRSMRKSHHMERRMHRENVAQNQETEEFKIIPRTLRLNGVPQPPRNPQDFCNLLIPKLEALRKKQEQDELFNVRMREMDSKNPSTQAEFTQAVWDRLRMDEISDQDILDQHVSRVWNDSTPGRSPGANSPCPNLAQRRPVDIKSPLAGPCTSTQSMRHSKTMPEQSSGGAIKKSVNRWGSINTDSGISLMSSDTMSKSKDHPYGSDFSRSYNVAGRVGAGLMTTSAPSTSSGIHSDILKSDDMRRSKRPPPPLPHQQSVPPVLPAKPTQILQNSGSLPRGSGSSGGGGGMQSNTANQPQTIVVIAFSDEPLPYRIKIAGSTAPTLRTLKEYLPKRGNYRFFFKTRCDDMESPVQEEISNDFDVLPLFDGKIMAIAKSTNPE